MERKCKYFIVTEGSDRAVIRSTEKAARDKKRKLERFSKGKKINIFVAKEKIE